MDAEGSWGVVGAAGFWAVVGLTSLAIIAAGLLGRLESERTIRKAIENGLVTDGETLRQLMLGRGPSWTQRLIVRGFIIVFAALGLGVFAFALGKEEPESTQTLLGIAAFVFLLGAGFLTAGFWLRRVTPDKD